MKWENCISVCTDRAAAMQGRKKDFIAHVMNINPYVIIFHCMIHREVLVSKCFTHELLKSMNQMIKVVKYIKGHTLRCRIFSSLCESMDAQFKCLLFHTEVRWLSKGKVLTRFICLKEEIISFLNDRFGFSFYY